MLLDRVSPALAAALLLSCAEAPAPPSGPVLAVDVAALNLVGVGDVVWDLEVRNGAGTPQVVWQRRVSSSGYGDGAGSASYVGTCDADANPNVVRVWVVGVYSAAVSDPGVFNSGSTADDGEVVGVPTAFQNPTTAGPLEKSVTCTADSDVAVAFDVALMRPAQQGFFDIAVNFNNIFCSAKFDCCDDKNSSGSCEAGEDLTLLFTAGGARGRTMVLGLACTAGTAGTDATTLYMDPLAFDCTNPAGGFAADFTVSAAAASPGNQCTAGQMASCPAVADPAPAQADTYLYQLAVYRGDELLTSGGLTAHKVYWNVALGVTGAIADCQLRTRATADNPNDVFDGLVGGVVAAGAVYPFIHWDVPLGACAEEALSFGATGDVLTRYTETTAATATAFAYGFAPGMPPSPVCAAPCVNGGQCTAPNTCTCLPGYAGPTCATDIDECAAGPCINGGTCTQGINTFTCACAPGYEGLTCATNHNDCSPNPCLNGGTCTDGVNSFTCACAPGFTGPTCAATSCVAGSQVFNYTGGNQSFTMPAHCTSLTAKLWGAGGGAGRASANYDSTFTVGGVGGFTTAAFTVAPGTTFTVMVGQPGYRSAGAATAPTYGGGGGTQAVFGGGVGGGRSALRAACGDIVTAGGGGGGSNSISNCNAAGSAGGGLAGGSCTCSPAPAQGGGGGTQTAGGAASPYNGATAGSAYQGGLGSDTGSLSNPGGHATSGGGGGYFGGGGGNIGPGGGGSGYLGGCGGVVPTSGSTTLGGGTSDPAYQSGAGVAGNPVGGPGLVVLSWGP